MKNEEFVVVVVVVEVSAEMPRKISRACMSAL